jgi:hypothetical protein
MSLPQTAKDLGVDAVLLSRDPKQVAGQQQGLSSLSPRLHELTFFQACQWVADGDDASGHPVSTCNLLTARTKVDEDLRCIDVRACGLFRVQRCFEE